MPGITLHTDRHELHGITVILETPEVTYVGRFDTRDERGIHLLNVAEHRSDSARPLEEFLARIRKFGVRVEHKHLLVPAAAVTRIRRLAET